MVPNPNEIIKKYNNVGSATIKNRGERKNAELLYLSKDKLPIVTQIKFNKPIEGINTKRYVKKPRYLWGSLKKLILW